MHPVMLSYCVVLLLPWVWLHWSTRVEGAEVGNRVWMAMGMTEKAVWEMTWINQLNIIPEYTEYIGLEAWG